MKKVFKYGKIGVLAASLALFATSCKKDTGEFPTQPSAGGNSPDFTYLPATLPDIADADAIIAQVQSYNYRIVTISPFQKYFEYGLAAFTNTTGNFTSLTSGGTVTVDTSNLTASSAMLYQSYPTTYTLGFMDGGSNWNIGGAGSMPATTYTFSGSNPSWNYVQAKASYFNDAWMPLNYSGSATPTKDDSAIVYSIPVEDYVSNADTVFIIFKDEAGYSYTRKALPTDSLVNFSKLDFRYVSGSAQQTTLRMEINAVKYNPVMVGTKKYYFIKMNHNVKYFKKPY